MVCPDCSILALKVPCSCKPSVSGKLRLLVTLVKALYLVPRRPFHTMPNFFSIPLFNRLTLRRAEARALKPPTRGRILIMGQVIHVWGQGLHGKLM